MNTETGEIKYFKEGEKIPKEFIPVKESQMTEKQKKNLRVSKYDSISTLGRMFTGNRKERRRQAKKLKNILKKNDKTNINSKLPKS